MLLLPVRRSECQSKMTDMVSAAELVDVIEQSSDGHDDAGNLGVEKFWFEETHSILCSGW